MEEIPISKYMQQTGKTLDKGAVISYVRSVSKKIVDIIGGTEFGPAAAFRDIVRSIILNRGEMYSVSVSVRLPDVPEEVNVGIPTQLGMKLGPNLWNELTFEEQKNITSAARQIHSNYVIGVEALEKT
jgi:malate/lactate dehydrogenase